MRELLRWDSNFYSGEVGGKALIGQVETAGTLANGQALTYAWGLQIARYRGLRVVEHSGALGGYRAHLTRFPEQRVSIARSWNFAALPRDRSCSGSPTSCSPIGLPEIKPCRPAPGGRRRWPADSESQGRP